MRVKAALVAAGFPEARLRADLADPEGQRPGSIHYGADARTAARDSSRGPPSRVMAAVASMAQRGRPLTFTTVDGGDARRLGRRLKAVLRRTMSIGPRRVHAPAAAHDGGARGAGSCENDGHDAASGSAQGELRRPRGAGDVCRRGGAVGMGVDDNVRSSRRRQLRRRALEGAAGAATAAGPGPVRALCTSPCAARRG